MVPELPTALEEGAVIEPDGAGVAAGAVEPAGGMVGVCASAGDSTRTLTAVTVKTS